MTGDPIRRNLPVDTHLNKGELLENLMVDRGERIRLRAHQLWEAEGSPEGREMDFWLQAEREVDSEGKSTEPLGRASPPPNIDQSFAGATINGQGDPVEVERGSKSDKSMPRVRPKEVDDRYQPPNG